jgi:hypothetical protein
MVNCVFFIEIAYLCKHLPTKAIGIFISISGCERFEYLPFEASGDPEELELLTAGMVENDLCLECADGGAGGQLWMRYSTESVTTFEGEPLSTVQLAHAAEVYWTEWQKKAEQSSNSQWDLQWP